MPLEQQGHTPCTASLRTAAQHPCAACILRCMHPALHASLQLSTPALLPHKPLSCRPSALASGRTPHPPSPRPSGSRLLEQCAAWNAAADWRPCGRRKSATGGCVGALLALIILDLLPSHVSAPAAPPAPPVAMPPRSPPPPPPPWPTLATSAATRLRRWATEGGD